MKKFLLFAFIAATLSACVDDSDCNNPNIGTSEIQLSAVIANIDRETKTTITGSTAAWKDGDVIGLFSPQAITAGTPPTTSASNVAYTLSGSTWTANPLIYWADGTTLHKFLAYYPQASGNSASNAVKLPKIDVQTGTINPVFDFLYSKNLNSTGVTKSSDPIGLVFTHALTLIEFKMNINATLASGTTLTSFVLASATTGNKLYTTDATATIDLSSGTITATATTNTATVTPTAPITLSATSVSVYVLILPGTFTAPNLSININEAGTTAISIPAASLVTTAFAAGTKYSYTVNISRSLINVSGPTITDWVDGGGGTINPSL